MSKNVRKTSSVILQEKLDNENKRYNEELSTLYTNTTVAPLDIIEAKVDHSVRLQEIIISTIIENLSKREWYG